MAKKIPLARYREWENHPVSLELRRICQEIVEKDSANFFEHKIKHTDSPESIALAAAELRGRNHALKRFYEQNGTDQENKDKELVIKDFFERNGIEWEE